jgi:AcrR family transcriptional regulator
MASRRTSSANLAWEKKAPPSRGPQPALTVSQIARVAIKIADAEGLEAVTMHRVARELGVTTMALYRYFPGKAHLVDLMIDSVSDSETGFGKPSLPWSARLKVWATRCRAIYLDHPWFLQATSVRHSIMGPNELSWMEAALGILAESGLAPGDRHPAFLALIGHVRGHATFQQIRKYNESPETWARELVRALKSQAHRFPSSLAALDSGAFSKGSTRAFDFGLVCILEGIRERVRRERTKSRRRS